MLRTSIDEREDRPSWVGLAPRAVDVQQLDQSQPGVAERIHAVQMAAYAQEAALIGAVRFPPLERTVDEVRSIEDRYYGASIGDVLAGVAAIELIDEATICVSSLAVAPTWQRRGIGRALLHHVVGCHETARLEVETATRNTPALSLYASCGFVVIRRRVGGAPGLELVRLSRLAGAIRPLARPRTRGEA